MEMAGGPGSENLLKGLFSSESATSSVEDLEEVDDEKEEKGAAEKKKEKKAAPTASKNKGTKADIKKGEEEEENTSEEEKEEEVNPIDKFIGGDEDEKEEGDEDEKESSKDKGVKKDDKQQSSEEENEEGNEEVNTFSSLSKDLYKLGVFTSDEDDQEVEIKTPEEFLERFNFEKRKGASEAIQSFIGKFGDDYQKAFEAIYVKGVDPKEYFGTYNQISDYAKLDLKQEANQVAVISKALADQGYEDEDITAEIDRLRTNGDLETVSQRHHKVLIKKEAARLQQLEQESEARQKQQMAAREQYTNNVNKILQEKLKTKDFDGIPINPKLAGELQDFLLAEKYKTPSGELLTDFDRTILTLKLPENHAMKVKVALLLKTLEKDPTLSTIQRKGVTKQADALFGEVNRIAGKTGAKGARESKGGVNAFNHL